MPRFVVTVIRSFTVDAEDSAAVRAACRIEEESEYEGFAPWDFVQSPTRFTIDLASPISVPDAEITEDGAFDSMERKESR